MDKHYKPAMQQPLPKVFNHQNRQGAKDFIRSPANDHAYQWIELWPDWPAPALTFFGGEGSGKSHLLSIWIEKLNQQQLPCKLLEAASLKRDSFRTQISDYRYLAIDNADHVNDLAILFDLYNHIRNLEGNLLFASKSSPHLWSAAMPELHSRLLSCPSAGIELPDDALIIGIISKLFTDRQIKVNPAIIDYFLKRMPRSFIACQKIVDEFDRFAHQEKKELSLPIAVKFWSKLDKLNANNHLVV